MFQAIICLARELQCLQLKIFRIWYTNNGIDCYCNNLCPRRYPSFTVHVKGNKNCAHFIFPIKFKVFSKLFSVSEYCSCNSNTPRSPYKDCLQVLFSRTLSLGQGSYIYTFLCFLLCLMVTSLFVTITIFAIHLLLFLGKT